ncbi:MAG: AI-2E family transporter [Gammaproteobacteria bacterium]
MSVAKEWLWVIGILLTLVLIYLLTPVLTPFLGAATLAYLFDPLVNKLQSWRVPRTLGVIIVFAILLLLLMLMIFVLVPLIAHQVSNMLATVPAMINWVEKTFLPWFQDRFDITVNFNMSSLKAVLANKLKNTDGLLADVWNTLSYSGHTLLLWGTNLLLIPVVMFYLLRDWHKVLRGARNLIPRPAESTLITLFNECHSRLSGFLRGQLMVMLGLGILYSTGLWLLGLNVAVVIGMVAGLISIVPYLGFIVGIASASIAAMLQFHDAMQLVWVFVVFMVAQSIEAMILTPLFVGDRIGMHPVAVLFAVLAGGQLFGFLGVLLALPVAAVLMVFIRYFRMRYVNSNVYARGVQ